MKPVMILLNKIQKEIQAPKTRKNLFGDYLFRNASDIIKAVKPLLGDAVLTLPNKMMVVDGKRYVETTATLTLEDESVSCTAQAREDEDRKKMNPEQLTGSAGSYSRKYALDGLFLTEDTPDPDTTNSGAGEKNKKATPAEVLSEVYQQYLKDHGADIAEHFSLPKETFLDMMREAGAARQKVTGKKLSITAKNMLALAEDCITPKLAEILVEVE